MLDEPANPQATSEAAVLAGGCFWGVQGVFQHVEGVTSAVSGYAGGGADTAHYEMVGTNNTGHAESVQVTFDPRRISYGHILQIYFSVAHDPTELNRQGPDVGTQYRSVIFPTIRSRRTLPRAISPSSTKHACLMLRSSQGSSPAGLSTRPRTITRTS
jgi:peptide-methionine (S)-S-oxide reductase